MAQRIYSRNAGGKHSIHFYKDEHNGFTIEDRYTTSPKNSMAYAMTLTKSALKHLHKMISKELAK